MRDGLYRVTSARYKLCAGFTIVNGSVQFCAPILRRRFNYWASIAIRIGD